MRIRSRGAAAWLLGCSFVALAGQAQAQTQPQDTGQAGPAVQPQDQAAPSGGAAATQASDSGQSGEIIVTAQRREQRLQDVPLSIDVVSSKDLERSNLTTIADLQFLSPGVNYNSNFGGGFNIRGVGTQSILITGEQSVGLIIDDVIQGLPEISFSGPSYQSLSDIDRIEVLRGPQGTLFGKNSSAGIIQIITQEARC
ncbi:MAG: Plug domain-containing protein [Gemmatales bacterium]